MNPVLLLFLLPVLTGFVWLLAARSERRQVIGPPRIEMGKGIEIADLCGNAHGEPFGRNDRDLADAGTAIDKG